ncbi:histidine phosphatase family protein [Imhoffiella purpurea]|uniref:Alpha-ribazole-5'-phosphate phosphatase n=1 Tax=Imhoffiella purpurea TaxID=1249627 RepID=W9V3K7_9GAMM|nr:alpha-ribazole phosphatase family protein [Imhoffiella purpurea]EXJ13894.1 Alpha-ribazole-5'-phosphate phosphatase [Imhoffiella purpurea]
MTETLIDLIRHGEPVGGKRYRGGGADDPLSELGWTQMREALGDSAPWDQIITSPMLRCQRFAIELAQRHALPLAVEPAFREVGMGAWEGRSHAEVASAEPEAYEAFYKDPVGCRPPGAEPLDRFCARVSLAFERQMAAYPGRHLLIVCHAGVSRAIAGHVLHLTPERWYGINIEYAGISRIRSGRFGPVVEYLNRHRL